MVRRSGIRLGVCALPYLVIAYGLAAFNDDRLLQSMAFWWCVVIIPGAGLLLDLWRVQKRATIHMKVPARENSPVKGFVETKLPGRWRDFRFDIKFLLALTASVAFVLLGVRLLIYSGIPAAAVPALVIPCVCGSIVGMFKMTQRRQSLVSGGMLGGGIGLFVFPGMMLIFFYTTGPPLWHRMTIVVCMVGLGMCCGAILSGIFGVFRMR